MSQAARQSDSALEPPGFFAPLRIKNRGRSFFFRYHFIVSASSTLAVARLRYMRRIIASASPTSAAAIVMTKIAKIIPVNRYGDR